MAVKQITRKQLVTKARKTQRGGSGRSTSKMLFPKNKIIVDARANQQQIDQYVHNVKNKADRIHSLFRDKHWLVELKEKAKEWGATVSKKEVTQKASDIIEMEQRFGTPLQLIQKLETAVQDLRTFIMTLSDSNSN